MTIQRARELLGKKISHLSDEQVGQLNEDTASLCSSLISFYIKNPVDKNLLDSNKN